MEIGVLLVQYAALKKEYKEDFVREHPELKSKGVIAWALTAAQLRRQTLDMRAAAQFAGAAFDLAAELGDRQLGAQAADMLAELAYEAGQEEFAGQWRVIAITLRADQ